MATPQAPLLTRIALTANWDAGYALLLDEPGWPPAAIGLQDEFDPDEKNRWINRRRAMRRLAGAFGNFGTEELRRGARLLATDPACGPDCSTIAARLSAEMSDHNLTEAAADAIKGWAALSEGCPNTEEDPIKASHQAAKAAAEYEAARAEFKPTPTSDELAIASIIDDWETVQLWLRPERRSIRGLISCHDELPYGSIFVADMIEVDLHHR